MSFAARAEARTVNTGQIAFRWLTAGLFILAVGSIAFATFGVFDAIDKAGSGPITKKTIEHGYAIHIAVGSVTVLVMLRSRSSPGAGVSGRRCSSGQGSSPRSASSRRYWAPPSLCPRSASSTGSSLQQSS